MKFAIAFGLVALASVCSAQIYNNGAPNQLNGDEMVQYLEADTFVLSSAATVGSVQYWDFETPGSPNDGTIHWAIYSDNSGSPGTSLDSGTTGYTHVSTGTVVLSTYNEYVDDFTLNTPFAAAAGTTYWLELNANPSENFTTYDPIYWEASNGTNSGKFNQYGTSGWTNGGFPFAYELFASAAPEPISMSLLAAGAIGLVVRRRSKTNGQPVK